MNSATPDQTAAPEVRHTPGSVAIAALKQLRPKQWAKNVFLLAAIVFSRKFLELDAVINVAVGIFSFSMLASSGYILNDYLDREADQKHPKKKFRPIASGALPIPVAWALMAFCLVAGFASAYSLNLPFLGIATVYLLTTQSYSYYFKHKVILDVMFLASGFVWRAVAGALALGVGVSPWLCLCTAVVALFLGFNKRRAELLRLGAKGGTRKNLEEYSAGMLEQFQAIVTGCTVLCYSLYTVQGPTPWLTLTIPYVLYGIFRYIYLVESKGEGDAPDETLLQDWPILLTVALYGLTAVSVLLAFDMGWLPELM